MQNFKKKKAKIGLDKMKINLKSQLIITASVNKENNNIW